MCIAGCVYVGHDIIMVATKVDAFSSVGRGQQEAPAQWSSSCAGHETCLWCSGEGNSRGPRRGSCFAQGGWRQHVIIGRDRQKSPAAPRIGLSYQPTTPGPACFLGCAHSGRVEWEQNVAWHGIGMQHDGLPERRKRRALTRVLTGPCAEDVQSFDRVAW